MSGKVAVSDKYARVRIKLCELADELAENDADVVLAVLKRQIPFILDRVATLEKSSHLDSNYAYHLGQIDQQDL